MFFEKKTSKLFAAESESVTIFGEHLIQLKLLPTKENSIKKFNLGHKCSNLKNVNSQTPSNMNLKFSHSLKHTWLYSYAVSIKRQIV